MPGDREKTNVEVSQETWRRLNAHKTSSGDSFDDVITRLLDAYEESEEGGER